MIGFNLITIITLSEIVRTITNDISTYTTQYGTRGTAGLVLSVKITIPKETAGFSKVRITIINELTDLTGYISATDV